MKEAKNIEVKETVPVGPTPEEIAINERNEAYRNLCIELGDNILQGEHIAARNRAIREAINKVITPVK